MTNNTPQSIILVGMPGAGKSTIGILLAKELGLDFLDTDVAIQVREGKTLQQIMDESIISNYGILKSRCYLPLIVAEKSFATGGSAVYSRLAWRT